MILAVKANKEVKIKPAERDHYKAQGFKIIEPAKKEKAKAPEK